MVRTLKKQLFEDGKWYCEFAGLSTDNMPKVGVITGSQFQAVDTGDLYRFDETSTGTWYKNPPDPET